MRIAMLGLKGLPATYGGVERYTEEVAVRLAARGHEMLAYCRDHYTPPGWAGKHYRGVQLIRLPSLNWRATDTLSHSLVSTLDVMRRSIDVVVYHSLGNALLSGIPRLRGTPTLLVLHCQEWREEQWAGTAAAFFRASERAAGLAATRVGVVSKWLQDELRTRYKYEAALLSTGTSLPEPQPADLLPALGLAPRAYLLFVGRLVSQKGVHLLLEAYSRLQTDMPLVIVGDAPHRGQYQETLRDQAVPGVHFLGYRFGAELAALYSHAYIYILPSEHEGIALSLLEAMAFGNAVVVSDIPPNLEAAHPIGFTFRSGDAGHLHEVLHGAIQHPEVVAERRALARAHVAQRYDWERVTDRIERVCVELVTPGKRHGMPSAR